MLFKMHSTGMDEIDGYIREMRRYFHMNPELSFKETNTLGVIERELGNMGLSPVSIEGGGIYADIEGSGKGKTIAVRADIDALPVTEENKVEYVSKNEGVMHACGHDAHTAMLLGLARMLTGNRDKFPGTVRLLFQQAEESPPGGAISFVKNGVLEGVDYVIGQHVLSKFETGKVGIIYGPAMANADEFRIKIHGKGGHGSAPESAVDALLVATTLVNTAQSIVSRNIPAQVPAVVTFGTIHSGYRYNIIAAHAELTGTVRTFDLEVQALIRKRLEEILAGICSLYGAKYEFEYLPGYPVLINNRDVAKVVESSTIEVLGEDSIIHPDPDPGGEDFAYYLQKVPGAFYFLGVRNEKRGISSPQHSPTYDIDEAALKYGAQILYNSVMKLSRM